MITTHCSSTVKFVDKDISETITASHDIHNVIDEQSWDSCWEWYKYIDNMCQSYQWTETKFNPTIIHKHQKVNKKLYITFILGRISLIFSFLISSFFWQQNICNSKQVEVGFGMQLVEYNKVIWMEINKHSSRLFSVKFVFFSIY